MIVTAKKQLFEVKIVIVTGRQKSSPLKYKESRSTAIATVKPRIVPARFSFLSLVLISINYRLAILATNQISRKICERNDDQSEVPCRVTQNVGRNLVFSGSN